MKYFLKVAVGCIIPFFNEWRKFRSSTILPNKYSGYLKFRKYLDKERVKLPKHPEYYGYIPKEQFEKVRSKYIDLY